MNASRRAEGGKWQGVRPTRGQGGDCAPGSQRTKAWPKPWACARVGSQQEAAAGPVQVAALLRWEDDLPLGCQTPAKLRPKLQLPHQPFSHLNQLVVPSSCTSRSQRTRLFVSGRSAPLPPQRGDRRDQRAGPEPPSHQTARPNGPVLVLVRRWEAQEAEGRPQQEGSRNRLQLHRHLV